MPGGCQQAALALLRLAVKEKGVVGVIRGCPEVVEGCPEMVEGCREGGHPARTCLREEEAARRWMEDCPNL